MATPKQMRKLLELFEEVPTERMQEILGSGLLTDLRDGKLVVGERKKNTLTLTLDPSSSTVANEAKRRGLKLVNDSDQSLLRAREVELELCGVLEAGEDRVNGEVMVLRSIKMDADKGEKHANAFLAQYKNWAPPKGVSYIAFPGMVLRVGYGSHYVPGLRWDGVGWCLDFFWLGYDWGGSGRLLRRPSTQLGTSPSA